MFMEGVPSVRGVMVKKTENEWLVMGLLVKAAITQV